MPKLNTLKSLGSLFRSSIKSTPATTTTSAATTAPIKISPAIDKVLKDFVSSFVKSRKRPQPSKPPSPAHLSSLVSIRVDNSSCSDSEDPTSILSDGLSIDLLDSEGDNGRKPSEYALKMSLWRKASSRERKQEWVFKKGRVNRVNRLDHSCAERLVADATRNLFEKLGTGMTEFNALLKICIENASTTDDETFAFEQVTKAFEVFMSMKELGFPIEEESYGQVLLYLIDRGMVEQFHLFTDVIKDGSASTLARLGYYEELLYTRANDEEKVEEFCNDVVPRDVIDGGDC